MIKRTERPVKFSTYLSPKIAKGLRRFAVDQGFPAYKIVEAALRKCLPQKYWND